jgi:hypothetical protein
MSLAFFYLVIGDLIIYHQKAIFNYDAFADQPLSKPDKSDKGSIYKLKDKKNRVLAKFLTFISEHINVAEGIQFNSFVIFDTPFIYSNLSNKQISSISYRGPPCMV